MSKRGIALVVAAVALGTTASLPAGADVIGFTGPFAPGLWTETILGIPAQGSTVMSSTELTINGGNSGCPDAVEGVPGPCEINITTNNVENPFSFHWAYSTADDAGPGFDLFGMLVDGNRIQLSDPGGPINQSGDLSSIGATTSFGWYINCTDCNFGAATAVITQFEVTQFEAPEPGSLALLGLGLAVVLGIRRKVHTYCN